MLTRLALILVCGLGLAACGSSSGTQTTDSPTKGYSQALAYSKCMRAHGVSNFPDPSTAGGGIRIRINEGTGKAPAFQSAQKACQHILPGFGASSPAAAAQARAQLLKVSECMRAHGISGFPDPTSGPPPSSPVANAAVVSRNGATLVIPSSIYTRSPAFQRAAAACNFGPRLGQLPKG